MGGLAAYAASNTLDVAYLLPFAAETFIYIAAADLLPELASETRTSDEVETTTALVAGLVILLAATRLV